MITIDSPFAPLYTLTFIYKLSYLLSTLLGQVWRSEDAHIIGMNTEEVLAEIDHNQPHTGLIIGSTNVKALYPSLDIPFAIEKVCEVFYDSDIKIDGMNYEGIGLYLSLRRTYDESKV